MAVSTAMVTRPAAMRDGSIVLNPFFVGIFMLMLSLLCSVLDLVEADAQPNSFACCWLLGRFGLVGREPLVNALQKTLSFRLQHLREHRRGTDRHSIIDRGAFEALVWFGCAREIVNVGGGDVRNDRSPQPDELFVNG